MTTETSTTPSLLEWDYGWEPIEVLPTSSDNQPSPYDSEEEDNEYFLFQQIIQTPPPAPRSTTLSKRQKNALTDEQARRLIIWRVDEPMDAPVLSIWQRIKQSFTAMWPGNLFSRVRF